MGEGRVQAGQVLPGTSGWQGADRTALHHPGALQPVPWLQKGVRSWGYMSVEPMGCADGVRRASEGKKGVRGQKALSWRGRGCRARQVLRLPWPVVAALPRLSLPEPVTLE